ncbi:MAG TPA: type II secretion system protein GspJ [Frateuria sp.]|uniref:type II secretion system protein GspJ n=1 Tax=Frateuria sp. TaxID=2211372 RepID=UPI002DE76BFD|nr:type II secretion system protein GspJ [Frateuria sp.]
MSASRIRGFSLMEVLAALVLLALLLVGVYSGIRTASHSVRAGSATVERLDAVRSAQDFLRRELAQAMTQQLAKNPDNDEAIFFKGDARSMSFVAPLPGYLGKLGPQAQTLELVDNGKGGQRLQIRFALLPPGGQPLPPGPPQVLLEDVRDGGFQYRGLDAQGRVGSWSASWPQGDHLPQLVRIDLRLAGTGYWPQLTVPLRVDASANQRAFAMLGRDGPVFAWSRP